MRAASSLQEEGPIVQFGVPPNRVDLINRIDGVDFKDAWEGAEKVVVADGTSRMEVRFIGLDSLILNKRAVGRPKDLDDLRFLEAARRSRRQRQR